MRGTTEAERQAFLKYGKGDFFSNAPRWLKNLMGGGGGLGAAGAIGLAGGGSAYYGLDPGTYGSLALLSGLGLAKYGNQNALRRARELQLDLLRRAPSAGEIPGTRLGAARVLVGPTLGTLGQRYTEEGYPYEAAGP